MNLARTQNPLLLLMTVFVFAVVPFSAHAQTVSGNLEVLFEELPLFNRADVLPGISVARTVTVKNTGSDTETLYTSTENETSNGLAALMEISIIDSAHTTYLATTTFESLFAGPPVSLGNLAGGETRVFTYTAALPSGTTNYANTRMEFDIIVGFEGGASVTDGGGGSGSGNNNEDDEEEPLAGRVEGVSTTTPYQTFTDTIRTAAASLRGMVAGASTGGIVEAATSTLVSGVDDTNGEIGRNDARVADVLWDESLCTFWWLLILAVILLAWSWFDDMYQKSVADHRRFFTINGIFTGVYIAALLGFYIFGVLEQLWWVFAAAWAAMVTIDYRAHKAYPLWDSTIRNWAFAGAGWFFITTSFFFGFPCVWWPFFALLVVSGLVYILENNE